ncbi:MAG: type IV pilus modification PilV family protein [Cellvibrionaceae bacterium]
MHISQSYYGAFKKDATKGFTLIELIVFIVVIAMTTVVLGKIYQHSLTSLNTPLIKHQLSLMAQSKIEAISARKFDENTPADGTACDLLVPCAGIGLEAGESLSNTTTLDDIDDFHGYNDSPRPGFSRRVDVVYAGTDFGLSLQAAKQIRVSVSANTGENITLSVYRVNH